MAEVIFQKHFENFNKFYIVERMRRHLYSFNSCILYTWVLLEALNNLYELPIYKPNSPSLWFDLQPSLFLSSLLFDIVFFMCIAATYCVLMHMVLDTRDSYSCQSQFYFSCFLSRRSLHFLQFQFQIFDNDRLFFNFLFFSFFFRIFEFIKIFDFF